MDKNTIMQNLLMRKTAILIVFLSLLEATSTHAQVIPDGTVDSRVTPQGNTIQIDGGTTSGSNLFHSFQSFSVPTGNTAYFNNNANIQNIITRVTGNSTSVIDGILRSNGTANLFFLNPNGIIFGKNARLDIGGSFLGTTANSIKFADGIQFGVTAPQSSPLLTIAEPVGLDFSSNSGEIRVSNVGHQLPSGLFTPTSRVDNPLGLQVSPGKTLALVGGDVFLSGGAVYAPGGRIEIGSVKQGQVKFDTSNAQWSFSYDPQSIFGSIVLTNRSLLDTTGPGGASMGIFGRQIRFLEDSVALMQNQGVASDKELRLEATDSIYFGNDVLPNELPVGLYTEATNLGSSAHITLISPEITLTDGAVIDTFTYTPAPGGNISLEAQNSIKIEGTSAIRPVLVSQINALAFSSGKAGDIDITTSNLVLSDGGRLSSVTFGKGNGGNIDIKAGLIEVFGLELEQRQGSMIQAGSLGTGDAGNLKIDTLKLILAQGGSLSTTTLNTGDGGSLTIIASDFIEVNGMGSDVTPETKITAEAIQISPELRPFFNLPPVPSGNSGKVTINTPRLSLTNGGRLSVLNEGTGNAGELQISANTITLEDNSLISATTFSGNGGNIRLLADFLLLNNSDISASAKGKGTGGNINIDSDLVVLLGNSSIIANAEDARAGDITINTLGLLLSPDSQITATSERGPQYDGNVDITAEITNFSQDPDLNVQVDPPDLYSACGDSNKTALAYYRVGTAGQPKSPSTRPPADGGWLQAAQARYNQRHINYVDPESGEIKPLKRVVGWKTNKNGTITFVNDPREADQYAPAIAAQLKACQTEQAKAS
ncbi:MAG: filamentous hemagglutinin N-terminal domain-containing protein [Leptolyngbyaceae cyanobacterium SU_3_3]|nr:filamentous hemagglutinin N-terminal domain-containing protein [Leptolyngbyaceae cyanobacterium SU_3_3]